MFYQSFPCLKEVYKALKKGGIYIIPVLFELGLPKPDKQWEKIDASDTDKILQLDYVQTKFGALNSIPSPPFTILNSPDALSQVVEMVHKELNKTVMPKTFISEGHVVHKV